MYAVAARLHSGLLLRAGAGGVPGDGRGRLHQRGRVPLPAPRTRRDAVRRPERDVARLGRPLPPGRGSGSPCWTPATSRPGSARRPRVCRRGSATGTRRDGRRGSKRVVSTGSTRPEVRVWRAIHSVRAVPRRPRCRTSSRGVGDRPLHVHLSEQPPRTTAASRRRRDTGGAARRPGPLGPAHEPRPRHPPHRQRRPPARRAHAFLLPDHRARPRRASARVAGSGTPVPLTLGSDSHAVVDLFEEMRAVELDERLATGSAATGRRRSCSPRRRPTATAPSAATAPARSRSAEGRLVILDPARPARPAPAATRDSVVFTAPAAASPRGTPMGVVVASTPTIGRGLDDVVPGCGRTRDHAADHRHRRADHQRPGARQGRPSVCSPTRPWCRGRPGRLAGAGRRRARSRRAVEAGGRAVSSASSTATPTWCSPATGPTSSKPG